MNKEAESQEFTIKGELVGTINLTDSFKKVKEFTQHEDRHTFLFIDKNGEMFIHWDLGKVADESFPIQVIKPVRKFETMRINF